MLSLAILGFAVIAPTLPQVGPELSQLELEHLGTNQLEVELARQDIRDIVALAVVSPSEIECARKEGDRTYSLVELSTETGSASRTTPLEALPAATRALNSALCARRFPFIWLGVPHLPAPASITWPLAPFSRTTSRLPA